MGKHLLYVSHLYVSFSWAFKFLYFVQRLESFLGIFAVDFRIDFLNESCECFVVFLLLFISPLMLLYAVLRILCISCIGRLPLSNFAESIVKVSFLGASLLSQPTPPPPAVPPTKQQYLCQPLLDAVLANIRSPVFNHSLYRTFMPAMTAIHGPPITYVSWLAVCLMFII